ncbi:MAG: diguanylate cyclase [bacterium]|nr:diguanylate cyclase [bacterium]
MDILQIHRLFELSKELILTFEEKELYPLIVDITAKIFEAEICSLMLIEEGVIKIKAAVGLPERVIKKTCLRPGEGIVGHVVKYGKPIFVKDIAKNQRFKRIFRSNRYYNGSLIISPIILKDKVIGTVNVTNKTSRDPFTEDDLHLLNIFSGHVAFALENARLHKLEKEEVRALKTERLRIKEREIQTHTQRVETLRMEAQRLKEHTKRLIADTEKEETKPEKVKDIKIRVEELTHYEKELEERAYKLREEAEELERKARELERRIQQMERDSEEARELELRINALRTQEEEARQKAEEAERQAAELRERVEEAEIIIAKAEEINGLISQAKELQILYGISSRITPLNEPREILRCSLERLLPHFRYHIGLYLVDEEEELIGEIVHRHDCPISTESIEEAKKGIIDSWKMLKKVKDVKVSFLSGDEELVSPTGKGFEKIKSFFTTPLTDNKGEITALISINSFDKKAFSESDKRLLSLVCSHVSIAITKARLFKRTKELAEKDELTGVYNYRYFDRTFQEVFKKATDEKLPLSLIMLDFDYLKKFNDKYGHEEGNRLIRTIADLIKKSVREEDLVARFGGDEFGIILKNTERATAINMAEEIRNNIWRYRYEIEGKVHKLSASLGIASLPEVKVEDVKRFFSRADEALYQAKKRGRNQVYVYGT